MRTVHIHLQSTSIVDTISSILKACRLPLDYLERIGINKHAVVNNGRQKVTFEWYECALHGCGKCFIFRLFFT